MLYRLLQVITCIDNQPRPKAASHRKIGCHINSHLPQELIAEDSAFGNRHILPLEMEGDENLINNAHA